MTRRCTLVLVVLCGWALAEGSARAQGLGGLRNRGYGSGYGYGPWDSLAASQAAQAERDAQQREAQERASAALRSSLSQHEAERQATAAGADAARQAAAARTAASQQAAVQSAWATYHANVERRAAAMQRQAASFPTDLGTAASATPATSSAGLRSTQETSPSVRSARGAAARAGFQHYELFTPSWFEKNPGAWRPAKWAAAGAAGADAWAGVDWPPLQTWLGWTGQHGTFDYGESLVIKDNQVLFRGSPIAKADEYYLQTLNIAQAGAASEPKGGEWQPLGVFALCRDDNASASRVIQMAVNKEGLIRGNSFDPLTSSVTIVRGKADRTLFLTACLVGDKEGPVVEAGIYNLTLDEAPLLYHLDKEKTQQMLLVRLTRPPEGMSAAAVKPPPSADPAKVGVVALRLPADAEVWFDGTRINLEGAERKLTTPPLEPGVNYYYHVRARWTENGRPVEQTRKVNVQAGEGTVVDFLSPMP